MKEAIMSNDIPTLKQLLATCVDVNSKDHCDGCTPLIYAARNNRIDIANLLLDLQHIDVNVRGRNNCTVLSWAISWKHTSLVHKILKFPSLDINAKDDYGITALMHATSRGLVDICKSLLLQPGININAKSNMGNTALIYASGNNHIEIVSLLLDFTNLVSHSYTLTSPLQINYIDLNAKGDYGNSALIWAAERNYTDIAIKLLSAPNIDVNSKNLDGKTALMYFAREGSFDVVRLMLEIKGIQVDAIDSNGHTALIYAVLFDHSEVIKLLLEAGNTGINIQDIQGNSALILAVENNNYDIVKCLLKFNNIEINAKSNGGYTSLMIAVCRGYDNLVKVLLNVATIDPNAQSNKGMTAIMYACGLNYIHMVRLLEYKLSANDMAICDENGKSIFDFSKGDVTKYLIYSGKILVSSDSNANIALKNLERLQENAINKGDARFLYKIRSILLICRSLSEYNNIFISLIFALIAIIIKNIFNIVSFLLSCLLIKYLIAKPFPNRINLLASRICGVAFSENITTLHSGMSMPKFLWVSALMRNAKLTKIEYGCNDYIFMHMLLLRDNIGSYLDKLPFELKIEVLNFVSAKDFSKNIKDLPLVSEALTVSSSLSTNRYILF